MTFYVTSPNFHVLSVIINFLLAKTIAKTFWKEQYLPFNWCQPWEYEMFEPYIIFTQPPYLFAACLARSMQLLLVAFNSQTPTANVGVSLSLILFKRHLVSVRSFGVMSIKVFSIVANHLLRFYMPCDMGSHPGDTHDHIYLPTGVCKGKYGLTYIFYPSESNVNFALGGICLRYNYQIPRKPFSPWPHQIHQHLTQQLAAFFIAFLRVERCGGSASYVRGDVEGLFLMEEEMWRVCFLREKEMWRVCFSWDARYVGSVSYVRGDAAGLFLMGEEMWRVCFLCEMTVWKRRG